MTGKSRHFQGQLVVITGGGSGIGRKTALAFARRGAQIAVSDVNLDAAKHTAAMIEDGGGTAHTYQLDVADEAAMHAHADEVVERHGVPDILINNAGIGQAGVFLATPSESFTRVMDINFYGVVNGCRTKGICSAQQNGFAGLLKIMREFADGGGFANAVYANY